MPFRQTFDCLWCGRSHAVRTGDDLEGWAQLCPACVGRAGENGFIRFRLHAALTERGAARERRADATTPAPARADTPTPPPDAVAPAAGATDLDDWYLRRGRYSRGPIHDAAWDAELDAAGRWLDELPLRGEIVELGAGSGWWAPLLAGKGELSLYDDQPDALDRARDRLLAHRLRAHLHVRDPWAPPDRAVDAVFVAFRLSRLAPPQQAPFLHLVRRWLRGGGAFVCIERAADPHAVPGDAPFPGAEPADAGTEVAASQGSGLDPDGLRAVLERAGFEPGEVARTGRFFLLGRATAPT
jgi:SAM-dependent methyltransferase